MKTNHEPPNSIDEYIAESDPKVQPILKKIRSIVRKLAPKATERISYGMPCFRLEGDFFYFAAFKAHIGLFPPVRGDAQLMKDVARYAGPKGNLRLPLDERIPYGLITRIIKAQVQENLRRAHERGMKNKRQTGGQKSTAKKLRIVKTR